MTGFARSEGSAAGLAWVWELRSVNGRGLDLRFRLPPGWDALEPGLREAAGKVLKRGNVNAALTLKREVEARLALDMAALEQALALALELHGAFPAARRRAPSRCWRCRACCGQRRPIRRRSGRTPRRRCGDGFAEALAALVAARQAEGARLGAVLAGQLDEIAALRDAGRCHRRRPAGAAAGQGDGQSAGAAARGAVAAGRPHRPGSGFARRPVRRARGTRPAGQPSSQAAAPCWRNRPPSAGASTSWCRNSTAKRTRCAASRPRPR